MLEATALAYLDGDATRIPLWQHATAPLESLRGRAEALVARVGAGRVVDTDAAAGGGSLPGLTIPSAGIAIDADRVEPALARLRVEHHVVARAHDGAIVCDLRSVTDADDERLAIALRAVIAR